MPSFLGAHAKASLKAAVVNAELGQLALNFEIKLYKNFLESLFCQGKVSLLNRYTTEKKVRYTTGWFLLSCGAKEFERENLSGSKRTLSCVSVK